MKADPDGGAQPLLLVVAGQVAQLLDLQLVALSLVDVRQRGFAHLGRYTCRCVQYVLEPGIMQILYKVILAYDITLF